LNRTKPIVLSRFLLLLMKHQLASLLRKIPKKVLC